MQYHTGYTSKKLDTRDAARLTQTLIPLALIYSSLHAIGKGFYGTLPEEAAKYVKGTKEMVADLWCRETLETSSGRTLTIFHQNRILHRHHYCNWLSKTTPKAMTSLNRISS